MVPEQNANINVTMTPAQTGPESTTRIPSPFSWVTIAWVSVLLAVCYAPVLHRLVDQWYNDEDMGHGFFVPVIAAYIAWQKRDLIAGKLPKPSWWGVPVLLWAGMQLYLATLGAELFSARTSFVISIIGAVLLLGGKEYLKIFAFPLFLLFFMVPIPAVIYNQITFPLQLLASRVAENAISMLQIPIIREGNVLELASQKLNVVEACSGIRSLLTLTFLSLVYGYFCEKRMWIRIVLFFSTIPIAIIANAGRVTLTGVIADFKPALAEGLFHEAQGWIIFMVAFAIMAVFHQILIRIARLIENRHTHELTPA
jgi:exosortase